MFKKRIRMYKVILASLLKDRYIYCFYMKKDLN